MNIKNLFEFLEKNLLDEINGELILDGNQIIWTFDLNKDSEEFDENNDCDEFSYNLQSNEEVLQEIYVEDLDCIVELISDFDDESTYTFSEPEIGECVISFKISKEK